MNQISIAERGRFKGAAIDHRENYYPLFDYIRGAAAIGVFFAHADSAHWLPEHFGNGCVQVFFALSGYLIGGILLRSSPKDLPRFYFNRSVRIWIPYAIAIGLLFAVTLLKQGMSDPKFSEFFFYMLTFVYNWFGPPQLAEYVHRMPLDGTANHFWSICVEEQFYLVAPFLILFLRRRAVAAILLGLVALNFFIPHYFSAIALGVLLAMSGKEYWFAAVSLAAGIFAFVFSPFMVWMPFLAVAIVGAATMHGQQSTVGRIIGGASYSFYLNHWIGLFAISLAVKLGAGRGTATLFGFVVVIAISLAHYQIIDAWIASNRTRFFSSARGRLACLTGFSLVGIGLAVGLCLTRWSVW